MIGVLQQGCDGHRANAAGYRGDVAAFRRYFIKLHITYQAGAAFLAGVRNAVNTYVYYNGIAGGEWSITAAAGLIKGVVGAAMVFGADRVARHFWQTGIFAGRIK